MKEMEMCKYLQVGLKMSVFKETQWAEREFTQKTQHYQENSTQWSLKCKRKKVKRNKQIYWSQWEQEFHHVSQQLSQTEESIYELEHSPFEIVQAKGWTFVKRWSEVWDGVMPLNAVMFHSGNFRRRLKKGVESLFKEMIEKFSNSEERYWHSRV